MGSYYQMGIEFLFEMMKIFWKKMVAMAVQH